MSPRPCRAEQRVGQRVRDDVPVGVAGEAAGMVDAHASEHERNPRLEGVGVHTDADAKVAHGSRLASRRDVSRPMSASGSDARSSTTSAASGGVCLQPTPGASPYVDRDETGGCRRHDVVVGSIADVGNLAGRATAGFDDACEEGGVGLANSKAGRPGDDVDRQPGRAGPALESSVLVAGQADEQPHRAHRLEALDGVRVQVVAVYTISSHALGRLDPEVAPEPEVLLAARDREAERGPDDVGTEPHRACHLAPVALLVDERLADVEEDRLQSRSHDSTRARSSRVVILRSRGSPGTTLMRPPARSTSDAQSVAPARSPA